MSEKIVIIGNGIAALSAIRAIREVDSESEIIMLGEEKYYPYNRIRLTKGLFDSLSEEKILLQKKEWYAENNIKLYLATKAVSIDVQERLVILANGDKLAYTKLLLANGASNFAPPIKGIDKPGVFTLRTLHDTLEIMSCAENSKKILIIGGGIQGLETAWVLAQHGKGVIVAEISQRLMPKELDERASEILKKALQEQRIKALLGTQISEIIGEDSVTGAITSQGDNIISCDMVIYATGIRPNIGILEGTGIETHNGVMVNEKMETNVRGVYAAGDIVEHEGMVYGLWNIAIGYGKTAGYNIAGKDINYDFIAPVTTLNAFNISLFSMGTNNEKRAEHVITENPSGEVYRKILIANNRVIGAIFVGDTKKSPALKTAIEKKVDLAGFDFASASVDELIEKIKER